MELKDLIYRRKSVRKYTGEAANKQIVDQILHFCSVAKPLYPDIGVKAMVVERSQVRFFLPWKTPQLIAVFSEQKPGYLENVGFLFQQVELYLQSIGLGAWKVQKIRASSGRGDGVCDLHCLWRTG